MSRELSCFTIKFIVRSEFSHSAVFCISRLHRDRSNFPRRMHRLLIKAGWAENIVKDAIDIEVGDFRIDVIRAVSDDEASHSLEPRPPIRYIYFSKFPYLVSPMCLSRVSLSLWGRQEERLDSVPFVARNPQKSLGPLVAATPTIEGREPRTHTYVHKVSRFNPLRRVSAEKSGLENCFLE